MSEIKLCPTCGRRPSERFGEDFAKCEYPGDGETYGPMVEYVPTGYVTACCPDPIHDLADQLASAPAPVSARHGVDAEALGRFVRALPSEHDDWNLGERIATYLGLPVNP